MVFSHSHFNLCMELDFLQDNDDLDAALHRSFPHARFSFGMNLPRQGFSLCLTTSRCFFDLRNHFIKGMDLVVEKNGACRLIGMSGSIVVDFKYRFYILVSHTSI